MGMRSFFVGMVFGAGLFGGAHYAISNNLIVREGASPTETIEEILQREIQVARQEAQQSDEQVTERFSGEASYYAASLDGNPTASGEIYRHDGYTAAHRTLPFGTQVRVTRRDTGQAVTVTINDRGPYADDRVIDLSGAAARKLDMDQVGVVMVDVEVLN
ncbi:MAG: septal ring lytic transglycosylase RlpA family protein [Pseudomonadota bacterium]